MTFDEFKWDSDGFLSAGKSIQIDSNRFYRHLNRSKIFGKYWLKSIKNPLSLVKCTLLSNLDRFKINLNRIETILVSAEFNTSSRWYCFSIIFLIAKNHTYVLSKIQVSAGKETELGKNSGPTILTVFRFKTSHCTNKFLINFQLFFFSYQKNKHAEGLNCFEQFKSVETLFIALIGQSSCNLKLNK